MEVASTTLSPSIFPSPALPFSSSRSNFVTSSNTISLLNKTKSQNKSVFVIVQPKRKTRAEPAKKGLTCNSLFGLGVPELAVIAGVAALVFGPKKLPEIGKSLGKTVKSFQQAAKEFEYELKKDADRSSENPAAVTEEKKPDVDDVSSSKGSDA